MTGAAARREAIKKRPCSPAAALCAAPRSRRRYMPSRHRCALAQLRRAGWRTGTVRAQRLGLTQLRRRSRSQLLHDEKEAVSRARRAAPRVEQPRGATLSGSDTCWSAVPARSPHWGPRRPRRATAGHRLLHQTDGPSTARRPAAGASRATRTALGGGAGATPRHPCCARLLGGLRSHSGCCRDSPAPTGRAGTARAARLNNEARPATPA